MKVNYVEANLDMWLPFGCKFQQKRLNLVCTCVNRLMTCVHKITHSPLHTGELHKSILYTLASKPAMCGLWPLNGTFSLTGCDLLVWPNWVEK